MDLFKFRNKRTLTGLAHADRRFLWGTGERFHDRKLAEMAEMADHVEAKMYAGGLCQLLNWNQTGPGLPKNTYTTIADLLPQQPYIFANTVQATPASATVAGCGTQFRLLAWGTIGSAAGTATTIMGFYLNGAASGASIGSTASQTPATSTALPWIAEAYPTIATIGSSGTVWSAGDVSGIGATAATQILMPTGTLAAVTFNTTQANYFSIAASWSASASGNTYTVYGFHCLQLN